ncbi:hypothetical protein CERSUDRAFT_107602 [Gelatoporia subvermispora B]|uniref:Protein kinase domain-containing protein n=1 Tax=Ceriporiopsis subvermispora (strain B) TaxID=914234 RepID=M2QQJ6_CERS8|nr:hypothetical protein CERSUDRAFT_107602 [Gelatoporia subvermispora B]
MCVVAFLPPGSLKVEYVGTGIQERTVHMPRAISRELDRVYELCTHYNAPLGMLTDEALSVAINGIERIKYSDDPPVLELSTSFAPTDPVQVAIGGMLHVLGCRNMAIFHTKSPPLQPYLGAVVEHAPTLSSLDEAIATRYAFEDWDLFTMQRCRDEWYLFWDWQHELRRRALVRPLDKGDTLKIKLGSDFGTRHFLMRSPYPKQPLPSEGYSIFATQARPRDDVIDAIFRDSGECDRLSDQHVVFTVSEVRRSGRLGYSQVVFGTLVNNSTKLCLKLYDERFFAIEEVEGYDDPLVQCDPAQRFNDLMTATYLARNEETIYDRLSELQGSLLPYYYGIRRVELPDGTTVWGLLTEFIEGPIIEHIDARDWSREAQIDFIRRMRHLFRALRYAGVTHNDDSPRNLLCPNIGVRGSGAPGIVLIDFAFSDPWLNDDRGTPPVYDSPTDKPHFRPLLLHVGISKDLVNEQWEPLDELEI